MAKTKKTTNGEKPKTTKAPKKVKVTLKLPGTYPEELKLSGTLSDLIEGRSLQSYTVTVNGEEKDGSYILQDNDVVLVGVKTKNN